ncbi:MAG TPA: hypothetical protein VF902_08940 [Coriobacteriia bacterium]
MPGPTVHHRLTIEWALDEGLDRVRAEQVGTADANVDQLWPGTERWSRHFNPPATLFWTPWYFLRAVREASPTRLGYALHCRQDAIGHGAFGLAHLRFDIGMLRRDPDDWSRMPPRVRAAIERDTRRIMRAYLHRTARRAGG